MSLRGGTPSKAEAISQNVIPAKVGIYGSPIKTHAALPQCCSAAFGDDKRLTLPPRNDIVSH